MVAIQKSISLNLVRDELDATLTAAEQSLEAFIDERDNEAHLEQVVVAFHQVAGICRVIEIPEAAHLASELEHMTASLKGRVGNIDREFAALGNAVMVLTRYLEYVQVKETNMPPLVIPAINELRRLAGRPLFGEGQFFPLPASLSRPNVPQTPLPENFKAVARRLRHMYQVGLLGVLRNENTSTSFKLMARALGRLDRISAVTPLGTLLWAAQGAVEGFAEGKVSVNDVRKLTFAAIDRQLKRLVYDDLSTIDAEELTQLLQDCLYLVAICPEPGEIGRQLIEAAGLDALGLPTADRIDQEISLLAGPGGSVIRTVAQALKDELKGVQDELDMAARGAIDASYEKVADQLVKVASTLVMLGLTQESQQVKEYAEVVRAWQGQDIEVDSEPFQGLVDMLLGVENAVAVLEKRFAPQGVGDDDKQSSKVSLYKLDDARRTVIGESRSGLSLTKRAITSYMESNWDTLHLNNVPSTLSAVAGGFTFLNMPRAEAILQACVRFIEERLMVEGQPAVSEEEIETFADAVTAVDYYLESIEENKPIGETVLEIAEEGLEALGYPPGG